MLPFWRPVTRATPAQRGRGNKNGQFLVAYHQCGDHLCFQGNKSVIWIREAFKMGIASYRGRNCRPLARELVRYWYSLCVTYPASGPWAQKLKKSPQSQDETNTFALFPLAAGAGRCNWWLHSVTTWLQCHLLVTSAGRDAATQVGGGCNIKRFGFNPYYLLFHVMIDLYRRLDSFQSKYANRGRRTVRLLNWEIRDNLSIPQDVGKHGHKSIILKGPFTADDKSNWGWCNAPASKETTALQPCDGPIDTMHFFVCACCDM